MAITFAAATNEHLALTDTIAVGTNDFSFSGWMRLESGTDRFNPLITGARAAGIISGLEFDLAGMKLRMYVDGSGTLYTSNDSLFTPDGSWHQVAVSADRSGNITFYHNGVAAGATDMSGQSAVSLSMGSTLEVARLVYSNSFSIDGDLAEVVMWNGYALTPADVLRLYAGGAIVHRMPLTVKPSALAVYLPMHDGAAGGNVGTVRDFSGNGYDFTGQNTPTWAATRMSVLGAGPLFVGAEAAVVVGNPWYYNAQQRVVA